MWTECFNISCQGEEREGVEGSEDREGEKEMKERKEKERDSGREWGTCKLYLD